MVRKTAEKITILAIDTSCDETSAAIMQDLKIMANIIASQEELHRKWGGVVPDIARRAHSENIDRVIKEAFARAAKVSGQEFSWENIDAVAVTFGPGLAIALGVGIEHACILAKQQQKPLIAINHMEGHLLSSLALNSEGNGPVTLQELQFPLLGVLISGKHTELVLMHDFGKYETVGESLDDAVGEAYDKVARMLGLGYPGGAVLTELAKEGQLTFDFPIPLHKDERLAFSYSGLKTAVYYLVQELERGNSQLSQQQVKDIAASFEDAAIRHLQEKMEEAIIRYTPKMVIVGGGVTGSAKVRAGLRQIAKKHGLEMYYPYSERLFTDNAAMIGVAAHFHYQNQDFTDPDAVDRSPREKIDDISY